MEEGTNTPRGLLRIGRSTFQRRTALITTFGQVVATINMVTRGKRGGTPCGNWQQQQQQKGTADYCMAAALVVECILSAHYLISCNQSGGSLK